MKPSICRVRKLASGSLNNRNTKGKKDKLREKIDKDKLRRREKEKKDKLRRKEKKKTS